jgi:ribosome biogenesis protein ERB1
LVPSVPKANDLRPFPTTQCVRYETPYNEDAEDAAAPLIRCLSVSPDGQYMASGASDGYVRLWEVSTGRLLKSWNVSQMATEIEKEKKATKPEEEEEKKEETEAAATPSIVIKPVVSLQWNPHKSHHCLIVAVGRLVVLIATGTGGISDAQVTDALLSKAASYDASSAPEKTTTSDESGDKNTKKQPNHITDAVQWMSLVKRATKHEKTISAFGGFSGAVAALYCPKGEVTCVKWHGRGDYFLSVSPKASGGASTLIHRISTAHSQQPFKKQLKGGSASETQCACFHPVKPFLFVASKQHIRIYHLIQQKMVKRKCTVCCTALHGIKMNVYILNMILTRLYLPHSFLIFFRSYCGL